MDNQQNLQIYRLWARVYDALIPLFAARARDRAIALLDLQPGERLLIPGVGTGLDLPYVPDHVPVVGVDLSPDMLARARSKVVARGVSLLEMDIQAMGLQDATFNSLLFNLILSVVPDAGSAFDEGWRMLKPGGRAVIFDKFLPPGRRLTPWRSLLGHVISQLGTDPNRRLDELVADRPDLSIVHDEPSLLRGQYRIVVVKKAGAA